MTRGQRLYVVLSGLFIAFLVLAEVTGSKLFDTDVSRILGVLGIEKVTMTLGVIPFPVVFIVTDLLNEYFGRRGVRFTTLVGMASLVFIYGVLFVGLQIPASPTSPVGDEAFETVFASSKAIIVASMIAFLVGQFVDISVFHFLRRRTGNRHIWLRATGSTAVSQLVDSAVVIYVAFGTGLGPAHWPLSEVAQVASTNYAYKLAVAIAITPVIYLAHRLIDRHLGREAEVLQERARVDEAFRTVAFADRG